jgi:hypothetical protein
VLIEISLILLRYCAVPLVRACQHSLPSRAAQLPGNEAQTLVSVPHVPTNNISLALFIFGLLKSRCVVHVAAMDENLAAPKKYKGFTHMNNILLNMGNKFVAITIQLVIFGTVVFCRSTNFIYHSFSTCKPSHFSLPETEQRPSEDPTASVS